MGFRPFFFCMKILVLDNYDSFTWNLLSRSIIAVSRRFYIAVV